MNISEAKPIIETARKIRAAYRSDSGNRYALTEPLTIPRVRCRAVGVEPFAWRGRWVAVEPNADGETIRITVSPYTAEDGVCDGCSLAPDFRGCIEAALFHDPWYLELDRMAADTGVPLPLLRRLGDAVFGALCQCYGAPGIVARVYYNAVRWFGGVFHRIRHGGGAAVVAVVLAALALAGCAGGCAGIPDILDGDPDAPVWEGPTP